MYYYLRINESLNMFNLITAVNGKLDVPLIREWVVQLYKTAFL